ncbi:S8 family peptidase [Priestia megaterium]|uniref:S8 family peptidase n=1 Tax=Priestia megaterium TaxID=1404 RepID=UPI002E236024|nr:S8 family peptidase [Priestia megaterium]
MDNTLLLPAYVETPISNYGIDLINARFFWEKSYLGQDAIIAILDTGCDVQHEALKDNIIDGFNFTTDDDGEINNVTDYMGHGTHVAGIAAATNKKDIIGVAPKAKLLIVKVIGQNGQGDYETLIKGLQFATAWRGRNNEKVDVINLSLGGPNDDPALKEAIDQAIEENISIVVSAGNNGDGSDLTDETLYPGFYKEVIQVSAVDESLNPTHFSNTNRNIDFLAPGNLIYSTFPENSYMQLSGTSMAAPHVTGAIALLISFYKATNSPINIDSIYNYLVSHSLTLPNFSKKTQGNGIIKL